VRTDADRRDGKRDQAEFFQQVDADRRQRSQIMFDHDAGILAPQIEHDLSRQRIALAFVPIVPGQIIFQALAAFLDLDPQQRAGIGIENLDG
jgi:hypothetical protein